MTREEIIRIINEAFDTRFLDTKDYDFQKISLNDGDGCMDVSPAELIDLIGDIIQEVKLTS